MDELIMLANTPGKLTAGGVLVMMCVGVWRLVVQWRSDDKGNEAQNNFRDDLITHNKELLKRTDDAIRGESDARQKAAEMKGAVDMMQAQIRGYSKACPYNRECGMPKNEQ